MIFLHIRTEGTSVVISKRAQGRVVRASLRDGAKLWDSKYLRLHFLPSAGARYKYTPRKRSTKDKKQRLAELGIVARGGRADLVHTGLSEQIASRPHFVNASATKATVAIITPSYWSRRISTQRIDKVAELLRIIPREETAIDARVDKTMQKKTDYEVATNRYRR